MIRGRHELCQEKMWVGSLVPLNGGGESDGKRQQKQKERNCCLARLEFFDKLQLKPIESQELHQLQIPQL
ncbi:hypothetical protein ACSBR2_036869 [Camellia fascicularis]